MTILTWQLWLAREIIEDNPLPWQKRKPKEKLTPGRVAQSFPGVLAAIGTPASPVKVLKMILIFIFNSRFLGESLVRHGLNRKNESKVIGAHRRCASGVRQKSRPRLRFVANFA